MPKRLGLNQKRVSPFLIPSQACNSFHFLETNQMTQVRVYFFKITLLKAFVKITISWEFLNKTSSNNSFCEIFTSKFSNEKYDWLQFG